MTKRVALQIGLVVVASWVIGVALLFLVVELSDGKAFDTTWLGV